MAKPVKRPRLPLPSWGVNLVGFGLLIALVLTVFFWQMQAIDKDLQRNTLGRSRMIAAIIEENLRNAALARTTIDTVVSTLLHDKARFVDYLQGIDPLQPEELEALARETGLLGIELIRTDGVTSAGPDHWHPGEPRCSPETEGLRYDPEHKTAQLTLPASSPGIRCIRIGLNATAIVHLQQQTSLPNLLATLSGLPGIHFVRLEDTTGPPDDTVHLLTKDGKHTAEARLVTAAGILAVGLDATNHHSRIEQMRRHFSLFAAVLLALGLFFSWLLYRVQQADLARTQTFERLLAREHEAAALGRATATIAHEVRNPLNAISMGLQRFSLESAALNPDQRLLLDAMEEAVRRAATIITELQRFTRTLAPRLQPMAPGQLLRQLLPLYRQQCVEQRIEIVVGPRCDTTLAADPDLMAELLENLLKNGIEAQPEGGFVHIDLAPVAAGFELTVTSDGCRLTAEQCERLGEPYFTTKTRGTGLGLALCRRIAQAHGGSLRLAVDHQRHQLTVGVFLPGTGQRPQTENQAAEPDKQGGEPL